MTTAFIILAASLFSPAPTSEPVDLGVFSGQASTGARCTTSETDAEFDAYERATERAWATAEAAASFTGCTGLTAVAATATHTRTASKGGADCTESFEARFACRIEPLQITLRR